MGCLSRSLQIEVKNISNMIPEGIFHKNKSGSIFALSTGFYSLGLVFNTKEVKNPPTSFWDLWKPEFANVVTVPSPSNAMGVPLLLHLNKALGGSVSSVAAGREEVSGAQGLLLL